MENNTQSHLIRTLTLQRQLFSLAAHQLKTPVLVLYRAAEKLHNPSSTSIIQSQCVSLQRLVQLLLRINELLDPQKTLMPLSLSLLLDDVFHSITSKNTTHTIVYHDTTVPDVYITAHKELFIECLMILLENALQHTPSGTRIDISVLCTDQTVEVSVMDNGGGFLEDTSRDTSFNTGLGLKLCRAITQYHNGDFLLQTSKKGTHARVLVPLVV